MDAEQETTAANQQTGTRHFVSVFVAPEADILNETFPAVFVMTKPSTLSQIVIYF